MWWWPLSCPARASPPQCSVWGLLYNTGMPSEDATAPPAGSSRSEEEIFADLENLAAEPGYAHVIANLCFRDDTVRYSGEIKADDLAKMHSFERLNRTEISTLVGLLVKTDIDLAVPAPGQLQSMLEKSDALLEELHESMRHPSTVGERLREEIFYSGESAYSFQYRNFAQFKYAKDSEWVQSNKGFKIEDAQAVARAILDIQHGKMQLVLQSSKTENLYSRTMLPVYVLTLDDVARATDINCQVIAKVLDAFSLPGNEKNKSFKSVSDFNAVNAFPITPIGDNQYLVYKFYSFVEALYESPSYWMAEDSTYKVDAERNRGLFTEQFCADCMRAVFGERRVYENVILRRDKGTTAGEIDVLVVFGSRAIIVQAKSKRLTVESRKGNDNQIREDFEKAIQNSYDQGLKCAKGLLEKDILVLNKRQHPIKALETLKEIYILCVISDHYPALASQARLLLSIEKTEQIMAPMVMDVFLLDVMAEMLHSPLYFLSYIDRRVGYGDSVLAANELTVLSYHLKTNLWLHSESDLLCVNEDIGSYLDAAMLARCEGLPGQKTPDGILTRLKGTLLGQVIEQIEYVDDPASVDFGFMLLTLGEDTIVDLNKGIEEIVRCSRADSLHHDLSIMVGGGHTGITVHANFDTDDVAHEHLCWHCEKRKYKGKAKTWFGLCLDPKTASIRFGVSLDFPWQHSNEMDKAVANLRRGFRRLNTTTYVRPPQTRIGRNDPCPCGSGKKYKKCCLHKNMAPSRPS